MAEKRKKHRKWFLLILILAVTAGAIWHYVSWRKKEAHRAEMRAMSEARRETYKDLMPKKMPGLCEDLPVPGTVTVNAEVKWEDYRNYYRWTDCFIATLETDESFDAMSDRRKYELLDEWDSCAWKAALAFREQYLEQYSACMSELETMYDKPVSVRNESACFIKTPNHLYQHAEYVRDYYVMDDRDHLIRDEKSIWYQPPATPTPTPKPYSSWRPSGSYKVYDPYDADDYDDPDDYAEEYEEEFGGGDDGYEDAYDHWVEWHEEHGE